MRRFKKLSLCLSLLVVGALMPTTFANAEEVVETPIAIETAIETNEEEQNNDEIESVVDENGDVETVDNDIEIEPSPADEVVDDEIIEEDVVEDTTNVQDNIEEEATINTEVVEDVVGNTEVIEETTIIEDEMNIIVGEDCQHIHEMEETTIIDEWTNLTDEGVEGDPCLCDGESECTCAPEDECDCMTHQFEEIFEIIELDNECEFVETWEEDFDEYDYDEEEYEIEDDDDGYFVDEDFEEYDDEEYLDEEDFEEECCEEEDSTEDEDFDYEYEIDDIWYSEDED